MNKKESFPLSASAWRQDIELSPPTSQGTSNVAWPQSIEMDKVMEDAQQNIDPISSSEDSVSASSVIKPAKPIFPPPRLVRG